jgi:RND family efflux transporter MFP subunit
MTRAGKILVPVVILLVALLAAVFLVRTRPRAQRTSHAAPIPVVEVMAARAERVIPRILTTGQVQPAQRVVLTAEVSGRIVEHPALLRPGSKFKKGEVLARIDPRDFRLAVEQEKSRVQQAQVELELEKGRQQVAQREWELLREGRSAVQSPLALRQPQLQSATQAVEAARSGLSRAQLNLERTTLRAPFNVAVIEESIEVGRVVSPGAALVTLIGTDAVWVAASLPLEDLRWVQLPARGGGGGSKVWVTQRLGPGAVIEREGRVIELGGELDPATRRATVLVEVADPFGEQGALPLLPGAHVEVTFEGREVDGVVRVPRAALVGGDRVWTVDGDGLLRQRRVDIGWGSQDQVYVQDGLPQGTRVVVSPLSISIEGSPVRVQERSFGGGSGAP